MKRKIALLFIVIACITADLYGQNENHRSKVVVAPYTVNIYTITGSGGKGTLITSNSSIQQNTVYYVEVSTSTSGISALLARSADGFETGFWNNSLPTPGFVPYSDPTTAQGDGSSFAFRIRTFSGFDFFTPLYMRVLECSSSCANPGGTGWGNNKVILFPTP
jgi:hypothetical protein